jgi:anti-anti-sigma regulatory factor
MARTGRNFVYADRQLTVTRRSAPDGLSFVGDIDSCNVQPVAACLNRFLHGRGDLVLDWTQLEFRGPNAIRALVAAVKTSRRHRRVLLRGLPPLLETVMILVGWVDAPNLAIRDGAA